MLFSPLSQTSELTVQAAHHSLVLSPLNPQSHFPWKALQKCEALPHCKLFLWKCLLGGVTTISSLHRYVPNIDTLCTFRHDHPQTFWHLFFSCPISKHLWSAVTLGLWTELLLAPSLLSFNIYHTLSQQVGFSSYLGPFCYHFVLKLAS